MRWVKKTAIASGLLLTGAVIGSAVTAYASKELITKTSSSSMAEQAGLDADVLSEIRLGNIDGATKFLEGRMDGAVAGVIAWQQAAGQEPDARARQCLAMVKTYRSSYPGGMQTAALLKDITPLPPGENCKWGVCRLRGK